MERLIKAGFDISLKEIFTSLTATQHFITKNSYRPLYMLSDSALEDFEGINTSNPNAVVVGLAPQHFHYEKLTEAFRLLQNGAKLIAINKGRYHRRNDGLALGAGAFVSCLEYAAGVQAECVGKPEKDFFLAALNDLDSSPCNAAMIGDDARDDVKGAIDCGLAGILVKTGKYLAGDETKFDPKPTEVCDSFPEAVEVLIEKYL